MHKEIFASIITIGDELLIGQVIDTNSAFIAQELNKIGISIKHRVAVGDNYQDIWNALDTEKKHSQIIIITGGLGPTADDITKPLLCKYFKGKMILHAETLLHVENIFNNILKRPLIERNRKQAEVPDVCKVLKNDVGTAPGMLFKENEVLFFSLPGVPHEMQWLIQNHVIDILKESYQSNNIIHKTLITFGVGESFIAERLVEFEQGLPQNIKLAYLPNYGMVRLRLTANGKDENELNQLVESNFLKLQELLKDVTLSNEDTKLEELLGKILIQKNATLSTAESCTGGYVSSLITSVSGSSDYYKGSVIAYSNEIKENVLHVFKNILEENGAVSENVVTQMAKNVLQKLNTNYSIAISGIMGPNGGTPEKPVGTVWIAVASRSKVVTKHLQLRFDRKKNIEVTGMNALVQLIQLIQHEI